MTKEIKLIRYNDLKLMKKSKYSKALKSKDLQLERSNSKVKSGLDLVANGSNLGILSLERMKTSKGMTKLYPLGNILPMEEHYPKENIGQKIHFHQ
jgi:hypothetical protein